MSAGRFGSVRTAYEIRKSDFLLWKERASLASKLAICGGTFLAVIMCVLAVLLI